LYIVKILFLFSAIARYPDFTKVMLRWWVLNWFISGL